MLKISKPSADRLDLELSGALDADAMRASLNEFIEKSEDIRNGKMFYTILDFEMPTVGAIAVELQLMPKLFGTVGNFHKCAVVSDTAWVRTAAEIEGAVIPGLEIKSFPLSQSEAAEVWLGDGGTDEDEDIENCPV